MLTNAFDQGLRFSIDKATFELLYLPLPSHVKSGVKGAIDVLVSRVGDGVGGLLLGLATQGFGVGMFALPGLGLGLRGLAACCAVACAVWVGLALVAAPRLRRPITDSLHQVRLDLERAAHRVHGSLGLGGAAKAFDAGDPEAILYVLRAFAQSGRRPPLDAVRALLTHETPAVRARALAALRAAPDLTIRPEADRLLRDPDIEVRTEALLWLALPRPGRSAGPDRRPRRIRRFLDPRQHGRALQPARPLREPRSRARAARDDGQRARPEGRRARIEAAMLLGACPASSARAGGSGDGSPTTIPRSPRTPSPPRPRRRASICVPAIATRLEDDAVPPAPRSTRSRALRAATLAALAPLLGSRRCRWRMRRKMPASSARIGTRRARACSSITCSRPDVALRLRVIGALTSCGAPPDLALDRARHRDGADGRGHGPLRSCRVLGHRSPTRCESRDPVAVALEASMRRRSSASSGSWRSAGPVRRRERLRRA